MAAHHASYQSQADSQQPDFLRMPSVRRRTGLGRSTIYRLIAKGDFPSPVQLSTRAVGWPRAAIDKWCEARASS